MGRIPLADEISCCAASRSSADRTDVVSSFRSKPRDGAVSICWEARLAGDSTIVERLNNRTGEMRVTDKLEIHRQQY